MVLRYAICWRLNRWLEPVKAKPKKRRVKQSSPNFLTNCPQTRTLVFIPSGGLNKFDVRRRFENNRATHFQPNRSLSSALTCSQGIPSCGLASKSARRRSSSAACSGVRSGSYPSSTMISQKSCASLILSSLGRAFAASRISVALTSSFYYDSLELQADNCVCTNSSFCLLPSSFPRP
jgi:hypothetical protein